MSITVESSLANPTTQEQPESADNDIAISVSLPAGIPVSQGNARELFVLSLVHLGWLSQSQAARALGISRYDLIELMGRYDLPIVYLTSEEMETQIERVRRLQDECRREAGRGRRRAVQPHDRTP